MEAQANHSDVVDGILEGACDLHVLSAPDHVTPLRLDALDTARYAQEAGLGGFALLNDHNPTGPQAQMLNRVYPGLIVHGAVTLNRSIGGLNAAAVEAAAGAGARIVRMPTRDAVAAGGELSVLDGSGAVTSEAEAVLDAAARHGLVVASGGLSHSETIAVFRAACDRGVRIYARFIRYESDLRRAVRGIDLIRRLHRAHICGVHALRWRNDAWRAGGQSNGRDRRCVDPYVRLRPMVEPNAR